MANAVTQCQLDQTYQYTSRVTVICQSDLLRLEEVLTNFDYIGEVRRA